MSKAQTWRCETVQERVERIRREAELEAARLEKLRREAAEQRELVERLQLESASLTRSASLTSAVAPLSRSASLASAAAPLTRSASLASAAAPLSSADKGAAAGCFKGRFCRDSRQLAVVARGCLACSRPHYSRACTNATGCFGAAQNAA